MKKKKLRKKILLLILSISLVMSCFAKNSFAKHPALAIMELYKNDMNMSFIEPYTVGILALNELDNKRHQQKVKQFILWYFSHLNDSDKYGLSGTIYDYIINEDGEEQSTDSYDSSDGYSGLFLHLLYQYVVETGDVAILQNNWDKIDDIAYNIPFTQDVDGLTFALPDSGIKYLMDNCETYGGIAAYIKLRSLVGKSESEYYNQVLSSIKIGIFKQLYDSDSGIFAWAIERGYQSKSSWSCYYPDAYAQILLIYYDVFADDPNITEGIWRAFTANYASRAQNFPIEQRIMYELTKKKMGDRFQ